MKEKTRDHAILHLLYTVKKTDTDSDILNLACNHGEEYITFMQLAGEWGGNYQRSWLHACSIALAGRKEEIVKHFLRYLEPSDIPIDNDEDQKWLDGIYEKWKVEVVVEKNLN